MVILALVTIDGVDHPAGTLAAFDRTEVRGVQDIPSLFPFGLFILIMVYGNGEEKGLSFKIKAPSGSITSLAQR